jgi:hypothetical protein
VEEEGLRVVVEEWSIRKNTSHLVAASAAVSE